MRSALFSALCLASGCGLTYDLGPPPIDCAAGETETRPCGNCGTQTFTCGSDGGWTGEGCTDEGVCAPGETMAACPTCPPGLMTCTETCEWPGDVACCELGTSDMTDEGCTPGSVRTRLCVAGCEYDLGDCTPVVPEPFVVVPFGEAPIPERLTLLFDTFVALGDVYFLFDESPSLLDDIAAVQSAAVALLDARSCNTFGNPCSGTDDCAPGEACSRLLGECIESPAATGCLAELWSGVGGYTAEARNLLSLQPSPSLTASSLGSITVGGAGVEAMFDAALAMAEPSAVPSVTGCTGPGPTTVGCPGFRSDARRLLLMFSDEGDSGMMTTPAMAGAALMRAGITLILFNLDARDLPRADMNALARAAGALRGDGSPLVFDVPSGSVVTALQLALDEALTNRPQAVTIRVFDDPGDAVDATRFIGYFETTSSGSGCTSGPTSDADGDGHDDTFDAVVPGEQVCFDLVASPNDTVPETPEPQLYPLIVEVLGDGAALDRVAVTFMVPPSG